MQLPLRHMTASTCMCMECVMVNSSSSYLTLSVLLWQRSKQPIICMILYHLKNDECWLQVNFFEPEIISISAHFGAFRRRNPWVQVKDNNKCHRKEGYACLCLTKWILPLITRVKGCSLMWFDRARRTVPPPTVSHEDLHWPSVLMFLCISPFKYLHFLYHLPTAHSRFRSLFVFITIMWPRIWGLLSWKPQSVHFELHCKTPRLNTRYNCFVHF